MRGSGTLSVPHVQLEQLRYSPAEETSLGRSVVCLNDSDMGIVLELPTAWQGGVRVKQTTISSIILVWYIKIKWWQSNGGLPCKPLIQIRQIA